MKADFVILSANTVPENYIWDVGPPLQTDTTSTTAFFTSQNYVSGYAPALRVYFYNTSQENKDFKFTTYDWDFGDYYNDFSNKVTLPCNNAALEHTFVMPGTYTVTLKMLQTKQSQDLDQTGNSLLCRGKYDFRWFWDETSCEKETALTWDEVACGAPYEKWWDDELGCFEKYCKTWSWNDLKTNSLNPIKWNQVAVEEEYVKKWAYEANDTVCKVENAKFLTTIDRLEQTIIKTHIVEVKEKAPVAGMHCVTRPITGISPFDVQLTPRLCKTGSFPIDRIDWDFGDGTPILTLTRYVSPTSDDIIYTDSFPLDSTDVRNYDVIHTYNKGPKDYPVFYPSLTCYSANTNTSDACSIPIGPIYLPSLTPQTNLLKVRNTVKGNLYTISTNDNVSFLTTNNRGNVEDQLPTIKIPTNKINDTFGEPEFTFYGNSGLDFNLEYSTTCIEGVIYIPPGNYITTEDSTPTNISDNLGDEGSIILSEQNLPFLP